MAENTEFEQMGLVALKKLLEVGNPDRVHEVSGHWCEVNNELLAVAQKLGKIVQDAQQHWEGAAADGFARAAGRIQQSLTNTAGYAKNTSDAMKHAGDSLQQAKTAMVRIPVPSTLDSGFKDVADGFDHSDTQFKADLASGMDRITAVNKNYGSLSAMEVSHQYAIGVMEHLAPQYTKAASYMQPPDHRSYDQIQVYPPPPSNPTPPGGIEPSPMPEPRYPDTTTTGSDGSGHQPGSTGTNDPGMPGSPGSPSTGIDGWTPPAVGGPVSGGGFTGGGVTGNPGLGAGTGGGFGGGVGVLPIGGIGFGSGSGSGSGVGFNRPSGTGTGAFGAGASGAGEEEGMTGAGRSGVGGMRVPGGLGGAEGEGESPGGLGGRSGGAVGGARPGGASGKAFTEGGTGLGRNRPGQSGMGSGMPGAHGGGKKDKQRGKRPDYLVEDEDTWRSNGRANPPVIE